MDEHVYGRFQGPGSEKNNNRHVLEIYVRLQPCLHGPPTTTTTTTTTTNFLYYIML